MVFEDTLRQKGENRFCGLGEFCFFTVHMSKTVDFNQFTTVHMFNYKKITDIFFIVVCEPL